jgi:4-amino-4-deoxy-L-arabinose transferase-like glycosyltransferase
MNEDSEIDVFAPWLVVILTVVGAGLRLFLLDGKGMWLDETFSVWLARQNTADMLNWVVKVDQHPPLYYLLLHGWVALNGSTPYFARMLSALLGAATIPVIYLAGRRMSGVVAGLAAAILLAVSPFSIRYAQETRMYTLLAFNAAVAIYALLCLLTDSRAAQPFGAQFRQYLRAWRTPAPAEPAAPAEFSYAPEPSSQTGWRAWLLRLRLPPLQIIGTDLAWVAYVVFSAATLLTHNAAVLFPLAANLFVFGLMLIQRKQKPAASPAFQAPALGNWLLAQLGIFLLWSPWLVPFFQQVARVDQQFWVVAPGGEAVLQVLKSFLNEFTLGGSSEEMVVWVLYVLVLALGLVHFRKSPARLVFLVVLFAVPFLAELLVSLRRPVFLDRTLIWTTIPLFLLLAAGIAQLKNRHLVMVTLVILGTVNLFSAGDYYRFAEKEDWQTPAGFVAYYAEKDDLILFNASWVQIPFDYYFVPFENQYSLQVVRHGAPADLFDSGILEPKMTAADLPRLNALLNGQKRVWLVYSHNAYTDPDGLIPQALAAGLKLSQQRNFYGGKVQLYTAP